MFFNMYSFTMFCIFVPEPCLFNATMLLQHASVHQRTMHCALLVCVSLPPCSFHFQVIHRLSSNQTPAPCGVVSIRHSTIGDGFIQHKTLNT